ncbi:MAG: hypothetical protein H6591_11770 [Flavobacteriales bacterium]|nr:hypothetical protein [Flavobacteriales bacterium]
MSAHTERERLEQVLLGQARLVEQVRGWLEEEQKRDDILRAVVRSSRKQVPVELRMTDPDRIFGLGTIQDLCIKHRLRFLEAGLYKGEVPGHALLAIRDLERRAEGPVTSYLIMAPSASFRLCDSEVDPLLFVPIGNDRYYLVDRWGNDLSPWRALRYWPVRAPLNLAVTVLLAALVLTSAAPASWLAGADGTVSLFQRGLLLFWTTMVISGFTLFGWFAFFGQFSRDAWNSRFFN